MRYGYVRATRTTQGRTRQLAALQPAGCDRIVEECSGAALGRLDDLGALIGRLQSGDTLCVARLDVLSRSFRRLLRILAAVETRGATFVAVTGEFAGVALPGGQIAAADLQRAADAERAQVGRRISAGRQRARHRGVQLGRPAKMTPEQQQEAIESWLAGEKVGEIAARYGVSRTVITGLTAERRHRAVAEVGWAVAFAVAAE